MLAVPVGTPHTVLGSRRSRRQWAPDGGGGGVPGHAGTVCCLKRGADGLTGAAEFFGDLGEGLPVLTAADDLVDVSDWAPAPTSVFDVVARDGEAPDVLSGHAMTLGDLLPALPGPVARGVKL